VNEETMALWGGGCRDKRKKKIGVLIIINPLNAELNLICHLLALLGAHHILHVSRVRVKSPSAICWHY